MKDAGVECPYLVVPNNNRACADYQNAEIKKSHPEKECQQSLRVHWKVVSVMRAVSGRGGSRACTDLTECIASQTLRVNGEHPRYHGITPDARNWWFPGSAVFYTGNHNSSKFFSTYFLPC